MCEKDKVYLSGVYQGEIDFAIAVELIINIYGKKDLLSEAEKRILELCAKTINRELHK